MISTTASATREYPQFDQLSNTCKAYPDQLSLHHFVQQALVGNHLAPPNIIPRHHPHPHLTLSNSYSGHQRNHIQYISSMGDSCGNVHQSSTQKSSFSKTHCFPTRQIYIHIKRLACSGSSQPTSRCNLNRSLPYLSVPPRIPTHAHISRTNYSITQKYLSYRMNWVYPVSSRQV